MRDMDVESIDIVGKGDLIVAERTPGIYIEG